MDCDRVRQNLADLALGKAPPAVANHVTECDDCSSELSELKMALGVLDAELERELSLDVGPQLVARVRESLAELETRRRPVLSWAFAAAAAAVVVTAVAILSKPEIVPPPEQPVRAPSADADIEPTPPVTGTEPITRVDRVHVAAKASVPPAPAAVPAVLVPPGQKEAIRRFLRASRSGTIVVSLPERGELEPPVPLTIAALESKPLQLLPIQIASLGE